MSGPISPCNLPEILWPTEHGAACNGAELESQCEARSEARSSSKLSGYLFQKPCNVRAQIKKFGGIAFLDPMGSSFWSCMQYVGCRGSQCRVLFCMYRSGHLLHMPNRPTSTCLGGRAGATLFWGFVMESKSSSLLRLCTRENKA